MPVTMPLQFQEIDGQQHVKVRIPVAVNERGEWIADGVWSRAADEAKQEVEYAAAECGYGNVVTHFVYALVPVPKGTVIGGEIE